MSPPQAVRATMDHYLPVPPTLFRLPPPATCHHPTRRWRFCLPRAGGPSRDVDAGSQSKWELEVRGSDATAGSIAQSGAMLMRCGRARRLPLLIPVLICTGLHGSGSLVDMDGWTREPLPLSIWWRRPNHCGVGVFDLPHERCGPYRTLHPCSGLSVFQCRCRHRTRPPSCSCPFSASAPRSHLSAIAVQNPLLDSLGTLIASCIDSLKLSLASLLLLLLLLSSATYKAPFGSWIFPTHARADRV
ncbi:hypothetical protein C8Q76DRAFT_398218 [Earliella scabrosa]|nr:hypothetical protein C8Q76DRAFT_398218 [Earliella scabrosa]